jgi:hypothetical protein
MSTFSGEASGSCFSLLLGCGLWEQVRGPRGGYINTSMTVTSPRLLNHGAYDEHCHKAHGVLNLRGGRYALALSVKTDRLLSGLRRNLKDAQTILIFDADEAADLRVSGLAVT